MPLHLRLAGSSPPAPARIQAIEQLLIFALILPGTSGLLMQDGKTQQQRIAGRHAFARPGLRPLIAPWQMGSEGHQPAACASDTQRRARISVGSSTGTHLPFTSKASF